MAINDHPSGMLRGGEGRYTIYDRRSTMEGEVARSKFHACPEESRRVPSGGIMRNMILPRFFKINRNECPLGGSDQGRGLGLVIFVLHEQFVYIFKFKSKRMPFFGVIKGGMRVVVEGLRFHAVVSIIKMPRLP